MCGIAGIVKWTTDKPAPWAPPALELSALTEMSAAIAHRGPDGEGVWIDPRPNHTVALLHRRLAIVDIPGGIQPMHNEEATVWVVFNGEIYNHRALRQELQAAGHVFASDHSDTEVLVHGYEQWGAELPAKLLGMFAFAIFDTRNNTLLLARDRMGQKPLFYANLEDGLVFGSTIPAVLAWPEVKRRVPKEQLALYLLLGYIPPPQTIYRDISQLLPGHYIRLRRDVLDGNAYWVPTAAASANAPLANPRAALRAELTRAVSSQLMADVPIACFLSGGIDSSIVATLMQQAVRQAGGDSIHTLSVGFAESAFDESDFAQLVAGKIGSEHKRLRVSVLHDALPTLQRLMHSALGQPFADSSILPTYHLSKAVRQLATVALSGDGGDELFAGYDRYRALPILHRWAWAFRHLPAGLSKKERWKRFHHAAGGRTLAEHYSRLSQLFWPTDLAALAPDLVSSWAPEPLAAPDPITYGRLRDQREYLPGDVLWKVDSAAMACALEVRSPFLDHHVVEMANVLPPAELVQGQTGKWALRQAFRDVLPPAILQRPKQGFAVPIGGWFRNDLRGALTDVLFTPTSFSREHLDRRAVESLLAEHQSQQRDHTHRLFALLMLELWWAQFRPELED